MVPSTKNAQSPSSFWLLLWQELVAMLQAIGQWLDAPSPLPHTPWSTTRSRSRRHQGMAAVLWEETREVLWSSFWQLTHDRPQA